MATTIPDKYNATKNNIYLKQILEYMRTLRPSFYYYRKSIISFLNLEQIKKRMNTHPLFVQVKGLEPPHHKALDPKSSVSTNFTIPALSQRQGQR